MSKVAFIGLGVMGYPMAGHLQKGGHDVLGLQPNHSQGRKMAGRAQGIACQ